MFGALGLCLDRVLDAKRWAADGRMMEHRRREQYDGAALGHP
jgi:hypothetical protein